MCFNGYGQDDDDDPLNSDDDADSDEGDDAVWETDNTIVCQFEKVEIMLVCTVHDLVLVWYDLGFVWEWENLGYFPSQELLAISSLPECNCTARQ